MRVYRIGKSSRIRDLSGVGAELHGGRWNHRGVAVLYTSESRSLATVEYLVHLTPSVAPAALSVATLEIGAGIVPRVLRARDLPRNWRTHPPPIALAQIGTDWIRAGKSLLLRVPSAVVTGEHNMLINPAHPDMARVRLLTVDSYSFDERLLR
ncbi:MAG: RES family NAD+ phosphorylase [Kiritimatiellae bacterium]|nr:RES family NAD+ phosphorylase [Kiritimatiellia bacterium]